MSKWYTYDEENVILCGSSGSVEIMLEDEVYLEIPFADVLALAESVKRSVKEEASEH